MELVFPWVIFVAIPVVIFLPLLRFKKKDDYKRGKKVANVNFVEETPYYKKLLKQYKVYSSVALASLLAAIAVCFAMLARPAEVETVHYDIHNRDIFLCMDVSNSVDKLNMEILDKLRSVIEELDGERFGITIFNGQAVLLVPLTSDYDYVLDTLDKLEASFKENMEMESYNYDYDDLDYSAYYYKHEGTLSDYGSSFIGDGLASCLYNFPNLESNDGRTKLIIFTTDNDLNGEPLVTLDEATALCAKHNVRVFAMAPEEVVDMHNFKSAVESTGGKFYLASDDGAAEQLVADIEKTEKSVLTKTETFVTDKPEALFVLFVVLIGIYFVCSRKVKL